MRPGAEGREKVGCALLGQSKICELTRYWEAGMSSGQPQALPSILSQNRALGTVLSPVSQLQVSAPPKSCVPAPLPPDRAITDQECFGASGEFLRTAPIMWAGCFSWPPCLLVLPSSSSSETPKQSWSKIACGTQGDTEMQVPCSRSIKDVKTGTVEQEMHHRAVFSVSTV